MLDRIKRRMFPLTLAEALSLVEDLAPKESKTRWWYGTPVRMLMEVVGGEDTPLTEITPEHIEEWQRIVDKEESEVTGKRRSRRTTDSYKRALRSFFNHLVKARHLERPHADTLIRELVFRRLPDPEPKHLSEEELERLIAQSKEDTRSYAMVQVLRASGIRLGGLLSMYVSDLEFAKVDIREELPEDAQRLVALAEELGLLDMIKDKYLREWRGRFIVTEKGQNGRKKTRRAFLDDEAVRALKAYLEIRPHDAPDEVWLTQRGTAVEQSTLYHAFKRIAKRAGVDCSPHDLRHTFAHRLVRNQVDPKTAAKLLGHSDPLTTLRIYYNPTDEDLRETYDEVLRRRRLDFE